MSYTKQTFTSGQILKASDLNTMSQGIKDLDDGKQPKLVSGTNLKTINGQSLLGSGNIAVEGVSGSTKNRPIAPEFLRTNLISHRGESISHPENTIVAFEAALANGLIIQECDVRMTSDNVPVLLHDAAIDRTSDGSGAINSMTYEDASQYDYGSWKGSQFVGTKIPTLSEFLYWCKENNCLAELDLADRNFTVEQKQIIYDTVLNAGMISRTMFTAKPAELTDYIGFDDQIIVSVSGITSLSVAQSTLPKYTNCLLVFPSIPEAYITKEIVDYVHSLGMLAKTYTIDSPSRLKTVLSYGADAVLTNSLTADGANVQVDLSNYYTQTEVDQLLEVRYTKEEVDAIVATQNIAITTLLERVTALEDGNILETYEVTYVINGHGTQPEALSGVRYLPATLPVLNAPGYRFKGWYMDDGLTIEAVASTKLTSNVTLYAKWVEVDLLDFSLLNYASGTSIIDRTGAFTPTNSGRVTMTDLLQVNAGDSISLAEDCGYKMLIYGYTNTEGGYVQDSYIDCNPDDSTSTLKNWGYSHTFAESFKYCSGNTASYPLYVRVVFRSADGSVTEPSITRIKEAIAYNVTADNSHLAHLFE